ncbi:histidine phosphatase family protein [Lacticaseibacillus brantae]
MTIRFYLVRHGETPMNKAGLLQGITDAPLTPKGEAAADRVSALLRPVTFSAAFSSDRRRAVETAQRILAPQILPISQLTGLREYYFGGLEGTSGSALMRQSVAKAGFLTMTQLWHGEDRFPKLIRNFHRMDPTGQAETFPELKARVEAAFEQVIAQSPSDANVLVVAHGVVLSMLVYLLDPKALPLNLLKNTSVTRVDYDGEWHLLGVNLTRERDLNALSE